VASVAPRGVEARREGVGARRRGRGDGARSIRHPACGGAAARRDRRPRSAEARVEAPGPGEAAGWGATRFGARGERRGFDGARRGSELARVPAGAVADPRPASAARGYDGGGSTDASLFPRRARPREEEPRRGTHRCEWRPRRARTRW
jgi:hypothetical protein